MKFIYLTNGIYQNDIFKNNINIINEKYKENMSNTELIYGGNSYFSNTDISNNNYKYFLENIQLLDKKLVKYIMYGGFDFGLDNNGTLLKSDNLINLLCISNNSQNNFKKIFILDYKIIDYTLLIFLNNQINLIEPNNSLVSNTCLKYLLDINQSKYKTNMTINDLVNLQMEELGDILKKYINIKSIIFISQSSLFNCEYQNNKMEINKSMIFFEFIDRYFYLLKDLNISYICGDSNNRNEISTITLEKMDNQNKIIGTLNINQFIVGISNSNHKENSQNLEITDEMKTFTKQLEIQNNLADIKSLFKITYEINSINTNYGFIEFEINKRNISKPLFNFIDSEKIIMDKREKIDEFKKKLKKKYTFDDNILDNVEISISKSNPSDTDNDFEITEDGDPYKEKYLKYKKKLNKLRNSKK